MENLRRAEAGLFPKVATLRVLARAHGMELDRYLAAVAEAATRAMTRVVPSEVDRD